MANKEVEKLIGRLEAAGYRIKQTKKGWMVYPHDKSREPVTIHKTPSDHRAWKNTLTALRRSGITLD